MTINDSAIEVEGQWSDLMTWMTVAGGDFTEGGWVMSAGILSTGTMVIG